ncbi:MAG: YeeE/YedE family protein [Rhodanobacteraceae bacterium]|nr:YeeE/YedE family protein [Rhodanobacteraceae bacterium]
MSAPLLPEGSSLGASLAIALVLGMGFGAALERAGLGRAGLLVGQFYGRDLRVFKVMFSALLVAMLGVFWLSRLGLLELSALYLPPTYLGPQLVGGVVFGAGLLVAGLCPGTACVAAATGRIDGVFVLFGLFTGMLGSGWLVRYWPDFYINSARGAWTLPELLGLSYGVVVCVIVLIALAAFGLLQRVERGAR